jgi:hypothetical protein
MADNEMKQEELSATVDQLWRSVVNGALGELVTYLITLLRQPSSYSSGTHKFVLL